MFDDDLGCQKTVECLVTERRLFIVDFEILAELTKPEAEGYFRGSGNMWKSVNVFYAPHVLLYR